MSPPIPKDWWVAAALTGAALPAAMGQSATPAERNPSALVTSVTAGQRQAKPPIYIENARGQKLTTGPGETLHVLFSDQSALTVGPNTEVVIAEYRFDKQSKDGSILIDMTKGLLRVVGGFISKKSETQVRTATATIGIRGGISVVESDGNRGQATFLFGQQMRATDNQGNNQTVTRPGFGTSFQGGNVGSPQRISSSSLNSMLTRLDRSGGGGGGGGGQSGGTLPNLQNQNPSDTLANDRLPDRQNPNNPDNQNPSQTLRNILGSSQTANQS